MDGICKIKKEYLIEKPTKDVLKVNNELDTNEVLEKSSNGDEPGAKKQKLSKRQQRKLKKGQNKSRKLPFKTNREDNLCQSFYNGPNSNVKCKFDNCKYVHDLKTYLDHKKDDIGPTCYIFSTKGYCQRGLTCRFGKHHIDADLNNIKLDTYNPNEQDTFNYISSDLQWTLRRRGYDFKNSENILAKYWKVREAKHQQKTKEDSQKNENPETKTEPDNDLLTCNKESNGCNTSTENTETNDINSETSDKKLGFSLDYDIIKQRKVEKRTIDFRDKLLLSPLTTVGNLPFRRICKEFGADITCGEMACAVPLINGVTPEWALVRRHSSEDIFGVQVCGNNAQLISYAVQILSENFDIDFVDLNLGCPIELIYSQGGGSALIRRENVLEAIVRSCSELLDGTPFTVKTRTGIYAQKSVAHELVPKFESWGAKAVTIHGRSREQRYMKKSDWHYIQQCAKQAREIPVIGNGDLLSFEDYLERKEIAPNVSSVMLGRGALIKPWIFQEIKEQKAWDISSHERFEIMQKYINYGLEYWGSDTQGVENTRRFFLEWQSFMYRYVPYGLLEHPPQKINERPEYFRGRDDLETLMASANCADWIKLSEMLLGPVPENYNFVPKHKANSYEG